MTVSTRRREARSPRLAKVIMRSTSGRTRLALVSVVVMERCVNSWVARLASRSRSCAGPPPSRGPFVGVGIACFSLKAYLAGDSGRLAAAGELYVAGGSGQLAAAG